MWLVCGDAGVLDGDASVVMLVCADADVSGVIVVLEEDVSVVRLWGELGADRWRVMLVRM